MTQRVFAVTVEVWLKGTQHYYDCAEAIGALGDADFPWREQRRKAMAHETRCRICEAEANVVHHLWPKRWPRENGGTGHSLLGLAVLCRACHAGVEQAPHVWSLPLLAARPALPASAALAALEGIE